MARVTTNIIWMLHEEGLCAVLFRLAMMYELIRKQNRIVTLVPYFGYSHYKDLKEEVSLCKYFNLPSVLDCPINTTRYDIRQHIKATNISCVPYAEIEHNPSVIKTVDCIESFIPYGNIHTLPWDFAPYSKTLLPIGKSLLDLHGVPLAVIHWRRGDQLTDNLRCGALDKSINCGTVESFIDEVETRVALFESDHNLDGMRVYIATDEDHPEVLQKFDDKGYKYSKHLVIEASRQNVTLNSIDSILIDLMLMCVSDTFFYYGYSSVNFVANDCKSKKLLQNSSPSHTV